MGLLSLELDVPQFFRQIQGLFGPFIYRRLGVVMTVEYELVVRDEQGRIVSRQTHKSHSFMRWYYDCMYSALNYATYQQITDISGNTPNVTYHDGYGPDSMSIGLVGNTSTNVGIVVGSSSQSVTPTRNKLVTQIGNGTSSGQLIYGTQSYVAPTVSGSTTSFQLVRPFTNSSGGDVTVTEIAVYVQMVNSSHTTNYVMIIYDVPSSQLIHTGHYLTVTYTFSITC